MPGLARAGALEEQVIQVTGLTRYYGLFPAIEDVSFDVGEGEIIGLLGLNGAGKSTTLKCLVGLLAPSAGTVIIDGLNVEDDPGALASRIGYLPENPPLYEDMTVSDFLMHCGRLKGMDAASVSRRLPEVLALADLAGRESQRIGTLSHGYRKRVGIAQAIIHDPKLVVLDEPISGLDPAQIVEMRRVIRNLGSGRAVILSSHILGEISQTCDRILVVHEGSLVAQGTESELSTRATPAAKLDLTVRGDTDALKTFLEGHAAVTDTTIIDSRDGVVRANITLEDAQRESLLADLIGAGFGLRLVEAPQDELEEIFLSLTRGGAA